MELQTHDAICVTLVGDISDGVMWKQASQTLRVLVLHLPFRQFRSTTSLSQYTVFHGLVSLTSLELPSVDASPSESPFSIFGLFTGTDISEVVASLFCPTLGLGMIVGSQVNFPDPIVLPEFGCV